ncbi:hypothetical protein M2260_001471 [Rhodococcus erythropolis]|nr:hypothetical protein [Rhodococcus erythropolis]
MSLDAATPFTAQQLDAAGRELLFTAARTANSFSNEPVTDDELTAIWELAKWAPTAANTNPLRVLFVRTEEGQSAPRRAHVRRQQGQDRIGACCRGSCR